ncbi:ATP-binding protein [Paenibacillus dokdonensis]|uniref:histidine kinase n=2 Tax=Paenibacillus dokdonensis TaxID=2567944 RepID=A0ABU6GME1_9BACL|nr:ATP-binding protein [Paenibacillus dokdonensis]MEC0240885.1 ATP-binding protein [Paenibacillus dokdonensis]
MIKHIKKATHSLMFRFTSWYVLSLMAIILFIGLCIMGAVSYFLIQDTKQELHAVEQKIIDALGNTETDWQDMLDEILYPDHANYEVALADADGGVLAHSRGGANNLQVDQEQADFNWVKLFLWDQTQGLSIQEVALGNAMNGQKVTIHILVQLDNIVYLLWLIVKVISITGIVSLFAGSYLIYRLTKRNLRPLFAIMDALRRMGQITDVKERIPVPAIPKELKDLAQTINDLLDQLQAQFEREKSFVSNASHELRTPLTAFRGHVQMMKRWGKQNPEVLEQSIQALDQESRRMQRLTTQLLTLARTGNIQMKKDKVNVSHTVQDAIRQLWRRDLKISLKEILNPHMYVLGDEEQLRQVAVILFENAIRYTNAGGSIEVRVFKVNNEICITVADSGIGIPFEDQDKIFDRFYRVDKARSRDTGGTGLGLSIAKELVKNLHGRISVTSKPGEGSIFSVYLPVYSKQ